MTDHPIERSSTTEGLPVSPSMGPALDAAAVPSSASLVDRSVLWICCLSIILAIISAFIAEALKHIIWFVTNVSFYGHFSFAHVDPWANHLGLWVIFIPVIGGIIVGYMARYGSAGIRGHGIPEAMEQVLTNQSRIPPRLTFLKPLSAAIAIGTGGPFGAEGPIIATGGALGSVIGQILKTTADQRKTLLAAGAAAGMAATFGSPVSAVLLAVELLLFEFRARSLIPVSLAAATAAAVRMSFGEHEAVFAMPHLAAPTGFAIACYILLGAIVGLASVYVTKAVYWIEDTFEHLPIHWMWWPAIGAVAVGIIGYFAPRTLGVGYSNITDILSGQFALKFIIILGLLKFVSWAIALGSGTSGGTLAPLFTIGSAMGLILGAGAAHLFPTHGIDIRVAALVGMAAIFAGASRALLASAIFAFETTLQPFGLLPLIGGCSAAYLVSCILMRNTIMTEKIVRRGIRVPAEYEADFLNQVPVRDAMTPDPMCIKAADTLQEVRDWIASAAPNSAHQGFPVVDEHGLIRGVITRRSLLDSANVGSTSVEDLLPRPPVIVYADSTLRDAADHMVNHDIGRLPVIDRDTRALVGILTRSDILRAHRRRLHASTHAASTLRLPPQPVGAR